MVNFPLPGKYEQNIEPNTKVWRKRFLLCNFHGTLAQQHERLHRPLVEMLHVSSSPSDAQALPRQRGRSSRWRASETARKRSQKGKTEPVWSHLVTVGHCRQGLL